MGFVSVITILNDALDQIDKDPAGWWRAAKDNLFGRRDWSSDPDGIFGFGSSCNHYQAAWCEHCDVTCLFLLKHGRLTPLITGSWHRDTDTDDEALFLIKEFVDRMGFRLVKKRAKKNGAPKDKA